MNNATCVAPGSSASRSVIRILVVDDEERTRHELEALLRGEGFLVELVPDDAAALRAQLALSNVREHEHREEEARQRAQLGALVGNLSEGVITAEANGHVRVINAAARGMLGLEGRTLGSADELNSLEARTVAGELLPVGDRPLTRALRGEEFDDCESLHGRPGGDTRRLLTSGTSVKDDRGNVVLAILVIRDVTELRLLERQREEYTALISHDLRSPLSSILMFASTLKQSLAKKGLAEEVSIAESVERNAVGSPGTELEFAL